MILSCTNHSPTTKTFIFLLHQNKQRAEKFYAEECNKNKALNGYGSGDFEVVARESQIKCVSSGRNVNTSKPFAVTATVCSHCADNFLSRVTTVQPSFKVFTR